MDKKQNIVVLGGGESGVGTAVLALKNGCDVWLSDFGAISDKYKAVLDQYGVAWEEKNHNMERILAADEVIKSPGIPLTAPVIKAIQEKGIPVISEIEYAGRFTDAKMICITGSNGKTTTTLLTYHILREAGLNVGLAGNVGKSLALQVANDDFDVYVIELSSFQLDNMYDFRADVSVIMNITPDHMDRYDHKMENYVDAKFRILQNQTKADTFIYWANDPVIAAKLATITVGATPAPFSAIDANTPAHVDADGNMVVNINGKGFTIARKELAIQGLHNLYNSMAASLNALLAGVEPEVVKHALTTFAPVEHRLEYVRTLDGVRYINDSKATNVDSTWYALESMTTPTVLILGGKDKGNDYSQIETFVKEKVKAIVCMGKDNQKLLDFFTGKVPVIVDTHSIAEALEACRNNAVEGDTVLLSPCCASFDLFKSYEDRGEQFKVIVNAMK